MIKDDIINNITNVFHKLEPTVLFAYLFGSTAAAERPLSGDIDIAVFFARGSRESLFEARLSLYAGLCRALKRNDVDLVVLNAAQNLILLDEIVRTGAVIYDRDPGARMDFELDVLHQSLDFKSRRLEIMGV